MLFSCWQSMVMGDSPTILKTTCLLSLSWGTWRVSNSQFVIGITEGKHGGISPAYILLIFLGSTWLILLSWRLKASLEWWCWLCTTLTSISLLLVVIQVILLWLNLLLNFVGNLLWPRDEFNCISCPRCSDTHKIRMSSRTLCTHCTRSKSMGRCRWRNFRILSLQLKWIKLSSISHLIGTHCQQIFWHLWFSG
jgi:hypothetical protein